MPRRATGRRRAPGRARRLVPRRRPGRRDADPARRRPRAGRHRAARRADPARLKQARRQAAGRAVAHPRRGRPRGRRAGGDRALPPAPGHRRRRGLELAGAARAPDGARGRSAAAQSRRAAGETIDARRAALRGPVAAAAPTGRTDGEPERSRAGRAARGRGVLDAAHAPTPSATSRCRCDLEPVDVLKVAHHGSADPGLPALLDAPQPRSPRSRSAATTPTAIRRQSTLDGAEHARPDGAAHRPRRHGPAARPRRPDVGGAMSPQRTRRDRGSRHVAARAITGAWSRNCHPSRPERR